MGHNDWIEYYILSLCKRKNLSQYEIKFLNYLFKSKIKVDYEDNQFILCASFWGNADMILILKNNGANINIEDNKPYLLALQNGNIECIKLLI